MNTKQIAALLQATAQHNILYKFFADNDSFFDRKLPCDLVQSPTKNKLSDKSLRFQEGVPLKKIFGIRGNTFDFQFEIAGTGRGHERLRMRTLHSSSLVALLCFYNLYSKPISIRLSPDSVPVSFRATIYEHQYPLSHDSKTTPACIDLTLFENKCFYQSEKVLLLESKFSEYLSRGGVSDISRSTYEGIYDKLAESGTFERMGLGTVYSKTDKHLSLHSVSKSRSHFYAGIKQMISHFMAACTFAEENADAHEYYLGEILFKFDDEIDKGRFEDYSALYAVLADGLNQLDCKPKNLHVLPQCLTYQEVFKGYPLDTYVKAFYKL